MAMASTNLQSLLRDQSSGADKEAVMDEMQRVAEIAKKSSLELLRDGWSDDSSHSPNMDFWEQMLLKDLKCRLIL